MYIVLMLYGGLVEWPSLLAPGSIAPGGPPGCSRRRRSPASSSAARPGYRGHRRHRQLDRRTRAGLDVRQDRSDHARLLRAGPVAPQAPARSPRIGRRHRGLSTDRRRGGPWWFRDRARSYGVSSVDTGRPGGLPAAGRELLRPCRVVPPRVAPPDEPDADAAATTFVDRDGRRRLHRRRGGGRARVPRSADQRRAGG